MGPFGQLYEEFNLFAGAMFERCSVRRRQCHINCDNVGWRPDAVRPVCTLSLILHERPPQCQHHMEKVAVAY